MSNRSRRQFLGRTVAAVGITSMVAGCSQSTSDASSGGNGDGSTGSGGSGSGSGGKQSTPSPTPEPTATATPQSTASGENVYKGVKITGLDWGGGDYSLSAVGNAKNVTDSIMDFIQIEAQFLDETDAVLESSLANTSNLSPGQTWRFEIPYPGMDTDAVDSFTFTEIVVR